jgi:hypothetical protein
MTPEDSLFEIAEIAIGLAGFSGLVAAFVQQAGHVWRVEQKARIVFLIVMSFGTIVAALAPPALSGASSSPAIIWGVPMVAFSVFCVVLLVQWIRLTRRHAMKLLFPQYSIPIMALAMGLQVANFLSGIGWMLPYSPTLFVFGFLTILVFGANMFLALLQSIWE